MNVAFQFGSQAIALLALPRWCVKGAGMGTASFLGMVSILSLQVSHENETTSNYRLRAIATIATTIFISLGFIQDFKGKCLGEAIRVLKEVFMTQAFTAIQLAIFSWYLDPNYRFRIREFPSDFFDPTQNNPNAAQDNPNIDPLQNPDLTQDQALQLINQHLNWLFNLAGETFFIPPYRKENPTKDVIALTTFLNKWRFQFNEIRNGRTEEILIGGCSHKVIAKKIIEYFKKAKNDPLFQEQLWNDLANLSCIDDIALVILKINIRYQIAKTGPTEPKKLGKFFINGLWTIGVIENNHVQTFTAKNSGCDPVEVSLKMILILKDSLDIPVGNIQAMRFKEEKVPMEDISQAQVDILEKRTNKEYYTYLISEPKWEEVIKYHYSAEYKKANDQRYADYDQEKFNAEMIRLSEALLE